MKIAPPRNEELVALLLLVNYIGNHELRSFSRSMLHPNNAC